jgi:hypothetical protein
LDALQTIQQFFTQTHKEYSKSNALAPALTPTDSNIFQSLHVIISPTSIYLEGPFVSFFYPDCMPLSHSVRNFLARYVQLFARSEDTDLHPRAFKSCHTFISFSEPRFFPTCQVSLLAISVMRTPSNIPSVSLTKETSNIDGIGKSTALHSPDAELENS